jgi:hypothetical protein
VLLNKAIENDHYPLSPGVQMLRRMRAKPPRCSTQPLPALRPTRWKSAMRHGRRRATSPGWKSGKSQGRFLLRVCGVAFETASVYRVTRRGRRVFLERGHGPGNPAYGYQAIADLGGLPSLLGLRNGRR